MEKNRFIKTALCLVLAFAMTFAPIFSSYAMIATAFTGDVQATEAQEPATGEDAAPSDEGTAAGQPAADENAAPSEEAAEAQPSAETDSDMVTEQNQVDDEEPAEAEAEVAEPEEEEEKPTRTEYVWKDESVIVTATLSDPEAIPDDAELVATAIGKDSVSYNYDAYMEALNENSDSKRTDKNTLLYDVAFIQDGVELQPESGTVSVTFEFLDKQLAGSIGAKKAADVNVIHLPLADNIKEKYDTTADAKDINASDINVETLTSADNDLKVSVKNEKVVFNTDDFSVFAYTVDFEYNGYKFSMPGGGTIELSKVFEQLHIDRKVADVENVKFSKTELVEVEKNVNDDDWTLTSKKAFSTEETLTVVMNDGEKIIINVTDAAGTFTVNINTYDYDGSTLIIPDPAIPGVNGGYWITGYVEDKSTGEPIGWIIKKFSDYNYDNTKTTTTVEIQKFAALDSNVESIDYDPSKHEVMLDSVRMITLMDQNKRPEKFSDVFELDSTGHYVFIHGDERIIDDNPPDGYAYIHGESMDGGFIIKMKKADAIDYYVRLSFEDSEAAAAFKADDKLYTYVKVEHKNHDYTYGYAQIKEEYKKTLDDGSIVYDIPISMWYTSWGAETSEKYTGHEVSTAAMLTVSDSSSFNDQVKPSSIGSSFSGLQILKYPVTDEEPDRIVEPSGKPHTDNLYDVVVLGKNKDQFDGYSLEYILNGYNIVTLCPNTTVSPSDSGASAFSDGDFIMENHCMGGVLVRGDILHISGTGVGDSEYIDKPSVVGGYVPANNSPFFNNRHNNNNGWNGYVGTVNDVTGDFYVNGKKAQENVGGELRGYTATKGGHTIESDSFIDWDKLQSTVISTSESMAEIATEATIKGNVLEVPYGACVKTSTTNVSKIKIKAPEGTTIEDLVGDNSKATRISFVDINNNSNPVDIPLVEIYIGDDQITLKDLGISSTGGSGKVEDGSGMSIVVNYPDAIGEVRLPTSSTPFLGHIVAPKAYVNVTGGNYNGCVVSNKARSAGEGHLFPYRGGSLIEADLGFEVGKTVNGQEPTEEQVYSFRLYELKNGNWNLLETKENNKREIQFTKIHYNKAEDVRTHWYLMDEDPASVSSGTADATKYIVKVDVTASTDAESGDTTYHETHQAYKVIDEEHLIVENTINEDALEIVTSDKLDGGVSGIVFKNTEEASGTTQLKIKKALGEGSTWPSGKKATFTLSAKTTGAPMPAEGGETVELSKAGEGLFGVINLRASDAGKTYEYTISETGDFGKGWSKTADVTATVTVTDDGEGKLSADVEYTNADTVTNSYSASGTTQLKITKALATGSKWPSGKKATFTLSAKTTGAPMPAEAGRTVELSEPGEGLFGVINLSTADAGKTYEYTISETGDFGKGWSKTADVTATVTVTDDGEGKLSADVEYTNADTVTNSYSASGIGEIKVKKNLVGRDWTDDDTFAFTLSPVRAVIDGEAIDVSSIPMPDVKSVTIKKTDEDQTKTFGNITFTKAGTYIYKVTETTKDGDGITCSEREKTITINAVDDGEGSIVPAEGSQMIQTAEITNTYAAQGIGEIFVKKVLEGRKWKSSDEFTFTISADDGTPMPKNDTITIKKSDKDQTKSFGEIEFTEEGTYTYTVKETRGSISGVTYDESEHTVTIEAVDDGQGHIVPAEGSQLIQTEEFTNTYEAGATFGEILVQKVLNGREWKDSDEFEFTLSASGDAPMPENDTIVITKDDEDHIAGFGQIEFTEPGKYTYIVKETRGDEKGMTYDSKEHKVTLEVVDDGNGKLVAKSGTKLIQTVKITNTFSKGVKTGDSSNIVLYSVTSLSALILLLITYIIRRRENNRA